MSFQSRHYQLESLLLDPNNYRFMDLKTWKKVQPDRYHDMQVQAKAMSLLQNTSEFEVSLLKDSILRNGLIPLEQIVVRPYIGLDGAAVVVEGNRRVAALKWLVEDERSGVYTFSDEQKRMFTLIPVIELDPDNEADSSISDIIMAIRHVSGVKQWGAYQRARLIVKLMQQEGASYRGVGERLGMSSKEVARRHRAALALSQMEDHEEFGPLATPEMHGLFQEAFATSSVKDWMEWNDNQKVFTNSSNTEQFYEWITGSESGRPKVISIQDVRLLRHVVANPDAVNQLSDPDATLDKAVATAQSALGTSRNTGPFETVLREATNTIRSLPATTLETLSDGQLNLLEELRDAIDRTLNIYGKLK